MKRQSKFSVKPKILIFVLTLVCIASLILSFAFSGFSKPFKAVAGVAVVPLQTGINNIGGWITDKEELLKTVKELKSSNSKLKKQVDELTQENSLLAQNKYELTRLRELLKLDEDYSQYEKVAANVIGKDTGNLFDIFIINRGSDDGLVGILYDVGKNYAKVRSIINDESSVSVSFANTSDTGIASGDLKLMEDNVMNITEVSKDAKIAEGDMVVTSQISDKFLPNILVGYLTKISKDASGLTQSGQMKPVVDFEHISEVLVIKQLKEELKD